MKDQHSHHESARLAALHKYRILDSEPEQGYDDFTFLASQICDAPIAAISLVDEHRQWLKSTVGLDVTETHRNVSFCNHAMQDTKLMVVPDAQVDDRFANNSLVTGEPNIRFYAGAPLTTKDGYGIGALCAIDRVPRTLTDAQSKALEALARQLMSQLEARRSAFELAEALEQINVLEGLIPICSYCKGIRDDSGFWRTLERYLDKNTDANLTHGICPDCMHEHFPGD